jgi:glyoxylase-like metal-dependent hydrolase (beta-lactamase superfamily II)
MKQEQEPAGDGVDEVGPGVLRVQLPIEMPGLGHVNTYLLVDKRGVAVVDPGLPGRTSWGALLARLGTAGFKPADVHTVIATHSHPDHYGGIGKLREETGAEVVTHASFRLNWLADPCDAHVHDVDEDDVAEGNPFEGPTPWGTAGFGGSWRDRMNDELAAEYLVHPRPARRLRDGDTIELAGRPWQAVHTPGHTLDHLCLADPESGLLLSGDHVLPSITPHISGLGTGRDPLKAFMASLDRVASMPGVRTALPAHGHPFHDLQERVDKIKAHHEERLDKLRSLLSADSPASVVDLSHELFREAHWGPMAESETYAHLEHLRQLGEIEPVEDGALLAYAVVAGTSPT